MLAGNGVYPYLACDAVLDQVRKFIPSLQAANKALERELEVSPWEGIRDEGWRGARPAFLAQRSLMWMTPHLQHLLLCCPEPGCQVRPASDLDIEHVDEGGAHIEMDLACGVFDLKDEQAVAAAEQAMARAKTEVVQSNSSCSSSSSSDDSSCKTDEEGDDARGMGSASERAGGSHEGTSGSLRRRDGRQSRRKGAKQKAAKITVVGDDDN
ncbi:hypothetical protein QJQ45_015663 [Haematococcus lacustris]|nr:hypothetical protein QJQ45_015663 [Haematococcus lacustris]